MHRKIKNSRIINAFRLVLGPWSLVRIMFLIFSLPGLTITATYAQDKIIAVVNCDVITQKDLDDYTNFMRMQLSQDYSGKLLDEKIESMRSEFLNKLIEDRLILQEAKKNNVIIDTNMVKARIEEIKKSYSSDADFQEALTQQGLVLADLQERLEDQMMMIGIIDKEVRDKLRVSPVEVTEFYQAQEKEFQVPEQWEFSTLSFEDDTLTRKIPGELKKGATLEDLEKKYSLSLNKLNAEKNGQLRKEIAVNVFKLKPGEFSEPIKVEDKYFIFRLDKIIPPQQLSLSEVKDKVHALVMNAKMEKAIADWLARLKEQAYIKISQG